MPAVKVFRGRGWAVEYQFVLWMNVLDMVELTEIVEDRFPVTF